MERIFNVAGILVSGKIYPSMSSKGAPNNYRSDRVSGNPSVIARSPCDEAIQGPQHAGRQQPRGRAAALDPRFANKKQTVTTLILLEKLCTEKEKRWHRF
jgi:hypothetical protein